MLSVKKIVAGMAVCFSLFGGAVYASSEKSDVQDVSQSKVSDSYYALQDNLGFDRIKFCLDQCDFHYKMCYNDCQTQARFFEEGKREKGGCISNCREERRICRESCND